MNRNQTFPRLKGEVECDIAVIGGGHGLLIGFYAGKLLAHWSLGKPYKDMKILTGK